MITRSKAKMNLYYINGKAVQIDNWQFHKDSGTFTQAEMNAFDNYIGG